MPRDLRGPGLARSSFRLRRAERCDFLRGLAGRQTILPWSSASLASLISRKFCSEVDISYPATSYFLLPTQRHNGHISDPLYWKASKHQSTAGMVDASCKLCTGCHRGSCKDPASQTYRTLLTCTYIPTVTSYQRLLQPMLGLLQDVYWVTVEPLRRRTL